MTTAPETTTQREPEHECRCVDLVRQHGHVSTDGSGRFDTHAHLGAHQLIWGPAGSFVVDVGSRSWLLTPAVALWMPAGVFHAVHAARAATLASIYLCAVHAPSRLTTPTVVGVDGLLTGLLEHLATTAAGSPQQHDAGRVLVESLRVLDIEPIDVRLPVDPRALAVAIDLIDDPSDARPIAEWGTAVGASSRTLSRLFLAETGMSFVQWRSRLRIRSSIEHLSAGSSVNSTARRVGYATPSAYVEAFRRCTGQSPAAFIGRARSASGG